MPPASMSKLMTVYMTFEALKDGRLALDTELPVSREAWQKGGSKMFVEVDTMVPVIDLLRGVIVQSGNDASIVLAEGIGGTESGFASLMNHRARELGLQDSHFTNSTGWPDPNHVMSPRDLALLTTLIVDHFPEFFPLFSETEYTYGGIKQQNRNPLLYRNMGAEGMKTGYTKAAGYGLTASTLRNGRRLVLVLNGMSSPATARGRGDTAAGAGVCADRGGPPGGCRRGHWGGVRGWRPGPGSPGGVGNEAGGDLAEGGRTRRHRVLYPV